jgi:hypothetical protein
MRRIRNIAPGETGILNTDGMINAVKESPRLFPARAFDNGFID